MTADQRAEVLRDLVLLRIPISEARQRLRDFPWDSESALVNLARADAIRLIDAYLSGALTGEEVEEWANLLESRDDLGFEAGSEHLLKKFVFQLANPSLTEALDREAATAWRRRLE